MSIPVLRFANGGQGRSGQRADIDLQADALVDLRRTTAEHGPLALVVRACDLDQFRGLGSLVIDRGHKGKAKELARRLLGQTRVPVINGSYSSAGQLARSVRALLQRAITRGDRNLFVIGATDELFQALWRDARDDLTRDLADVRAILDLLPAEEIPADLARKYLGQSEDAQLVRRLIMRAASQEETVLILGDTGTGKEVVARAIHDYSPRRIETFVSVNCAAIPHDLFESELFGHEPQAFTGAVHRKPGLWTIANRGTLFLDEIGDLRPDHQAKILRSLQDGRVRPVGALKEIDVNARVLAATNRDLVSLVEAGLFREDLYYRLRSFFIPTPSLARHPEDIPLIARAFWKAITRDPDASLGDKVIEALSTRSWPGNARELRAVLSNVYGLFGKTTVTPEHLGAVVRLQSGLRIGTAGLRKGRRPASA
ncbi:MAG: sigma 54-interacting transcriptional regulator [Acidobacteriota bacterium]